MLALFDTGTRLRRAVGRTGLIVLALGLFYLALRGVSLVEVLSALRQGSYWWLAPLIAVALASHVIRAWRWQELMRALPEQPHVPLKIAFGGVMVGYMVNYALPRVGELVRCTHVAGLAKLRLGAVFGTVVTERILDVMALLAGLAVSLVLLLDRADIVQETLLEPAVESVVAMRGPFAMFAALAVIVALTGAFALFRKGLIPTDRLKRLWHSFRDGLLSARHSTRKTGLIISTVLMFLLYAGMAYIPLVMFDIARPYALSFLDALAIMFIGAIGVVVPAPGGIGSFHYITRITLVSLFGVPAPLAVTYAVFVHGAQLVLYALVGLVIVLVQGTGHLTLGARPLGRH